MSVDKLPTTKNRTKDSQPSAARILETLKSKLPGILAPYPVMLAYAYGSLAEDCMNRFSDIDIGLVFPPDSGLDPYQIFKTEMDISIQIEQAGIRPEADVRTLNQAPLRVQGHVLTTGQLLYSRDEDFRVEYEVLTRKRYFDFQPVLYMMREAYFARLEANLAEKDLL